LFGHLIVRSIHHSAKRDERWGNNEKEEREREGGGRGGRTRREGEKEEREGGEKAVRRRRRMTRRKGRRRRRSGTKVKFSGGEHKNRGLTPKVLWYWEASTLNKHISCNPDHLIRGAKFSRG